MSIRLRLTLWYSGLLASTLIIFGVSIYLFVNYYTYTGLKSRIIQQAQTIYIEPSYDFIEKFKLNIDNRRSTIQLNEFFIQVVNYRNPAQSYRTRNLQDIRHFPYPEEGDELTRQGSFRNIRVENYPFLVYEYPLILNDGSLVGLLQVAATTEREESLLRNVQTILIVSSLFLVLAAFTIGLFLARKALKPIENVIRATNQIENGSNLSVRIAREGPNDEMGQLTDTLNGMLERLETTYNELDGAYKTQRRFVSDASHELRTPLTTIRGNIDLLEKMWVPELQAPGEQQESFIRLDADKAALSMEAMRDISDEAKRMTRLVSDLLSLARADAGYQMEKSDVALLPLVEEVARRAQLLPRTVELRLGDSLASLAETHVYGSEDYLRQLIFIFIENAFKYTPEGYVELQAILVSGQAGLIIKDTGIGLDKEEVPHIFERFYRADESRGKTAGTGLGLSIAKWIIDEHGGSIEVKTRLGEGTTFVIWLPISFAEEGDSDIIEDTDR
ncbi:sensor histidine kinase [Paenibacillus daejeonensis]|uniref:sensor histidine kinase n=1 Tax=Paenibacillus daejeonensis TaxID=135193 RepID=UPI0003826522|nr:HAMP domain-containing sensor histidine kinase [Paenibacillus daejeonensis]